jgi:ATP-dependent RNA circularization protein (DNA/RNA ligase family)
VQQSHVQADLVPHGVRREFRGQQRPWSCGRQGLEGEKERQLGRVQACQKHRTGKNLRNQVKIYEKASDADKSIKVIMYFSDRELEKVTRILKNLGLEKREDIVLIDASPKVSASKADEW